VLTASNLHANQRHVTQLYSAAYRHGYVYGSSAPFSSGKL